MPLASEIMDRSAALLNDVGKTIFPYTAQIPYLNTAIDEFGEELEYNNIPITNSTTTVIPITTAMFDIGGTTGPPLPTDLIDIQQLWERITGTNNDFVPMIKFEFLPKTTVRTSNLGVYSWQNQIIRFVGSNSNVDVKIDYVATILPMVANPTDVITKFNSRGYLSYKTASLCARFIGENPTRADELDALATQSLDRVLGIDTKGKQDIPSRRRPFRASAKIRGVVTS